MNAKKLFSFLMVAMMLVSVIGCAAPAAAPAPTDPADPAASSEPAASTGVADDGFEYTADGRKIIKFGWSMCNTINIGNIAVHMGVEEAVQAFNDEPGHSIYIDLTSTVADDDATAQMNQITSWANSGYHVIAAQSVDSNAVYNAIEEAHNAGARYIAAGIVVEANSEGIAPDCFIGGNMYTSGYESTKAVLDIMLADGYKPEDIKSICIVGGLFDNNAALMRDGGLDALKEYGCPEPMAFVESDWNTSTCLERLSPVIQEHKGEFNFILTPNTDMLLVTQSILEREGMWFRHGEEGHIYLGSQTSMPAGLKLLCEGYLDADATCAMFEVGEYCVKEIARYFEEGQPMENHYFNKEPITRANFEQLKADDKLYSQRFWESDISVTWDK